MDLDVNQYLFKSSVNVFSIDIHSTEPWILTSLCDGFFHIWNYRNQRLVKKKNICHLPVRAAKFIPRKNWVVTGSDDMQIQIFNYNTLERVHQFKAHSDYLRSIAVHPTQPFVITSSDDLMVKLWDWDNEWQLKQTFEGHTHYVMQLVINPKENNAFATASLDKTIKLWHLDSKASYTLYGHKQGVKCIDYYHGGDKPYLISGADDRLIKIWDYENKICIATIDGHSNNVSAVCFHPELSIIITGSEDSKIKMWNSNNYSLEKTLSHGFAKVSCIALLKGSNTIAIGQNNGSIMMKLSLVEPAVSMDSSGKILWAKQFEIQQANLKISDQLETAQDGERLLFSVKNMGGCKIYPQTLQHSSDGQFVVACGNGKYIVYTAMTLRTKATGKCLEFVWSSDPSVYAVHESLKSLAIFKDFVKVRTLNSKNIITGIGGGLLLSARSSSSFCFHNWETPSLIRRIEIAAKHVYWSENGQLVAIAGEDSFFILRYNAEAVANASPEDTTIDGIENSFEVIGEQSECVKTGIWVGDCFIFTTATNRINYYVGGKIVTIAHSLSTLYLLGFIPKDDRIYLCDVDQNIVSYKLLLSVLEYQTALVRRDFDLADKLFNKIPKDQQSLVKEPKIINVWRHNLENELNRIRATIIEFPFIAMDTEFPGVVAAPMGAFQSTEEFQYNQITCNVNMLKIIQVGFCLTNSKGELPPDGGIWQFNFNFSEKEDLYAVESLNILKRSGIDFDRHRTQGIRGKDFRSLITSSGIIGNDRITWLTFHSCFDFGYLIKTIIGKRLPDTAEEFLKVFKNLIRKSFDLKTIATSQNLSGGLQTIAQLLNIEKIGQHHQAGSDALLTSRTYFGLTKQCENWEIVSHQFQGKIYGLCSKKIYNYQNTVFNKYKVEKNATPWSKDRLKDLLIGQSFSKGPLNFELTEFKKLEGEATANNRLAKLIFLFEWEIEIKFKATVAGSDTVYDGHLEIPNLSDENDANEVDVVMDLTTKGAHESEVRHVGSHEIRDLVRKQLETYIRELKEDFSKDLILMSEPLVICKTIKVPPERLYEILTEPSLVQVWSNGPAQIDVKSGGSFSLLGGQISGTFDNVKENEKLVMKWRLKKYPANHFATITMTLKDQNDSTDLIINAEGVPVEYLDETLECINRYYVQSIGRKFGCGMKIF